MGKIRLTVVREWEPDLDGEGYKNVEWPAGSNEYRDLTTLEEIKAFEQHLYESGETSIDEILNVDDPDDYTVKWEVIPDEQVSDPALLPQGDNPFLTDDQLDRVAESVKDGLEADRREADAGVKEEAGTAAAETKWQPSLSDEARAEEHRRSGDPLVDGPLF